MKRECSPYDFDSNFIEATERRTQCVCNQGPSGRDGNEAYLRDGRVEMRAVKGEGGHGNGVVLMFDHQAKSSLLFNLILAEKCSS